MPQGYVATGHPVSQGPSYMERREIFKSIWNSSKLKNINKVKPTVIKTLRISSDTIKTKKRRINNLKLVCNKILNYCDRQEYEGFLTGKMAHVARKRLRVVKKRKKLRRSIKVKTRPKRTEKGGIISSAKNSPVDDKKKTVTSTVNTTIAEKKKSVKSPANPPTEEKKKSPQIKHTMNEKRKSLNSPTTSNEPTSETKSLVSSSKSVKSKKNLPAGPPPSSSTSITSNKENTMKGNTTKLKKRVTVSNSYKPGMILSKLPKLPIVKENVASGKTSLKVTKSKPEEFTSKKTSMVKAAGYIPKKTSV